MRHIAQQGQSILEVLFITALVSLVLVAVLSTTVSSLRNSRGSLQQAKSTRRAEEVLEWLRQERDTLGWVVFAENIPVVGESRDYCFAALPSSVSQLPTLPSTCNPDEVIAETELTRTVTLERTRAEEVVATVRVERQEKSGTVSTTTQGVFTAWD